MQQLLCGNVHAQHQRLSVFGVLLKFHRNIFFRRIAPQQQRSTDGISNECANEYTNVLFKHVARIMSAKIICALTRGCGFKT